jgi:hypothetical protein
MINNVALIIISKLSMSYFMIQGVDMWGGDLYSTVVTGYDTALQTAKQLINEDSSKCVSFRNIGGDNFQVWVKDAKKTNSSKGTLHNKSFSIFYGSPC